MSGSVWVAASENVGEAAAGDVILARAGDLVRISEVAADGDVTACAEVKADLLPNLPSADAPHRVEDETLLRAVRGVLEAERERGA